MERVPGCWEHMSVVWDELKSRKTERSSSAAIWVDIANAYGSVPHQLLFFALRRYDIPEHWVSLFIKYYEGLWSINWSESAPSGWHHHLGGIFIGCAASIILFLSAINVIIEHISAVTEDEIYKTMTSAPVKAFMDDMFLMSQSIPATQVLLDCCAVALIWAKMSFRASKSRSMVIDKGKVIDISSFSFKGEITPSIHANPVRFLGRTIDFTVSDKHSVEKFVREFLSGLKLIHKSSHKGILQMEYYLWILQNMLIPRLHWPLLIYEISISAANCIEHKISSFLRKWLNIHHSTTNICLYSSTSPCPLPLKSLTSILKSTKVSGHLL